MNVAVVGGSSCTDREATRAREVGELIGGRGHDLVCGGLGGVMAAACEGATAVGGHTVGILPGAERSAANEFVDTAVATGMGNARNALVVRNGDGVVAIDGGTGTLSELGLALDADRPVAGLGTHRIDGVDGIEHVETPRAAVDHVEAAAGSRD